MPVRQRGDAFQADVIVGGRRKRKDFRTEAEAVAWEAAQREELEATRPAQRRRPVQPTAPLGADPGPMVTLGDAFNRTFDRYYRGKKWADKTWNAMQRVLEHFGANFPLKRFTVDTLDAYVTTLRDMGKAGSTINGRLAILSKSLKFAHSRGALATVPKFEREPVHNLRLRWLSGAEEEALLRLMRQWGKGDHADAVEVLIDTGFRPSELFAISPGDVTMPTKDEPGTIRVWQTRHGKGDIHKATKNGDMRTIYMTDRVAEVVRRRLAVTEKGGLLFPWDVFWMRNVWDRARAVMGLGDDPNFVPYVCRHTCASRLVQRGVDLAVIQKWMGHKTIQITMRYANVAPANLKDAMRNLNKGAAD